MYWKIFHNLIKRLPGVKTVNKSYLRNYVRCSEKAEFNSDKGLSAEDKSDDNSEERLNKLLENSSPLKRLAEDSIWATSPYPKGTVFQDETDDKFAYTDVESLSVIMFPGQGTQYVGMGSDLLQYPIVQDMFASAGEVLGYNLLKLCLKGPAAKLNKTEYCQPAVMVCSLAALERLKDENPEAINRCVAACGYSVGEISALVFAGCLSFEKGVSLVKIRAEAMQACSESVSSGMMTVLFGADSELNNALSDAKEFCRKEGIEDPVCSIACYLFAGCKVVAGHTKALDYIASNAGKYKLRKLSRLPVSGAFHTSLMRDAAEPFQTALKKAEIRPPLIPILSNVDGQRYSGPSDLIKKLPKQIYSPVKWQQLLQTVYNRKVGEGFPSTYECGPGSSLTSILRKNNAKAAKSCHVVSC